MLFPHHEVDEQTNKKPKKGYYVTKRRESDDKNGVAIVKNCTTIGLRLARLDALASQNRKTVLGNPMQSLGINSKSSTH